MSEHFADFDDALAFLNNCLQGGISKLLEEARRKGCIAPPYGRPPTPSPFVDESQIDEEALLQEDLTGQSLDINNFDYDYGFNPLLFLSEYIRRVHPASVAARQRDRVSAVARLRSRALHAQNQLSTAVDLKNKAHFLRSGIMHGPLTTPLSSNSVMIWCRPAVAGEVIVEVSKFKSFSSARMNVEVMCFQVTSNGPDDPVKVVVDDLSYGTHYYVRCHMQHLTIPVEEPEVDPTEEDDASKVQQQEEDNSIVTLPQLDKTSFALCQFWTFPDTGSLESDRKSQNTAPVEVIALARQPTLNARSMMQHIKADANVSNEDFDAPNGFGAVAHPGKHPILTCFVGDIFEPSPSDIGGALQNDMSVFDQQIWELFNGKDATLAAAAGVGNRQYCSRSPAALSSLLFAWNDTQVGSDTGLKAEEVVHKQFSYDTRKYEKRIKERQEKNEKEAAAAGSGHQVKSSKRTLGPPPVFNRPVMSPTFGALVKDLPVVYAEENIRHLYRTFALGANVDVFVLDNRNGYMGKEQIRWLKDGLRRSGALMKIIFTGKSFGVNLKNMSEDESIVMDASPSTEEGSIVDGEVEGEEEDLAEGETSKEKEDPSTTTTSNDGVGEEKKEKADRKISSSRKRALEATQEEFDDYGISKATLQHAIVNTFRHMYPQGYEPPEGGDVDGELNDEDNEDDIFHQETEDASPLNSGREEKAGGVDSGVGCGFEDEIDMETVQLLGGILIVSASSAADTAVSSFSFSDAPLVGKAFCAEVSIGSAQCEPGECCKSLPHSSVAVENMLSLGRRNVFRASVMDIEALGCDAAEVVLQSNNPLASSLTVRKDGAVKMQLREYGTGNTLFKILFTPPEVAQKDE